MKKTSTEDAVNLLESASEILVVSHYNPDADAFGSSCAMFLALKDHGKSVTIVNESGVPKNLSFIPGTDAVETIIPKRNFDLVVVCDCGEPGRVGDSLKEEILSFETILNIDHHISNDGFGSHNIVEADVGSASELVYPIVKALRGKVSVPVGTCLFAGISRDTGSFRFPSTSAETFRIAAELVDAGVDTSAISEKLYGERPLSEAKLQAAVVLDLELEFEGKVALAAVPTSFYEKFDTTIDAAEGLSEYLRGIEGVDVSAVLKQQDDIWRVSLRSTTDRCDVSLLAKQFGGGGHRRAAAFRSKNSESEIRQSLLDALRPHIEGQ